jgi:GTP cyclohydrolase IB
MRPAMQDLRDTQNEPDPRGVPIKRVGVRGLRFPVCVRDKNRGLQHTIATVALAVDLPHHYKGTHMSRFLEVLQAHGPELEVRNIRAMPRELLRRLDARRARVEFDFPYFMEKAAPATGARGLMDYGVRFRLDGTAEETDFVLTVRVPVATLCPCSKAISDRGAHNQRGEVRYSVRSAEPIWIEDLVRVVEQSASCELFSVLKRPDEKWVTERAYDHPVFVEDLVRNIAVRSRQDANVRWFRVEAENFESIHNHNAFAVVEWPGGDSDW